MSSLIRSVLIRGYGDVVHELGGQPLDFLRAADLPPAALTSFELLLPLASVADLLERSAQQLSCPDFGLRLARSQDALLIDTFDLAVRHAPTVGEAVDLYVRFMSLTGQGLSVTVGPDPYSVRGVVALAFARTDGPGLIQGSDLALYRLHTAMMRLAGADYGLRSVELPYRPAAPLSTYERAYGVRINTRQPASMLRFSAETLNRRVPDVDEIVGKLALTQLSVSAREAEGALTPRVRGSIDRQLGTGHANITTVAQMLDIPVRTLQRRLAAEQVSFAELLDDVRRERARIWLTTTEMPVGQVSALLDLANQSALSRCAKRWWGESALAVRRSALSAARHA